MRMRRVKVHSGCVDGAHVVFEHAAKAARAKRLRSVDMSWSLKLGCGAARGCAAMMEKHGGGFPLERLAMRKANIKDPGAMSLAGAIRRSAEAVSNKEKAERSKEWSGHREGVCPYESPYGDREPVCELRWLDLGSNHINDPGAVALGDALGPKVPITRLNLRDNQVGIQGCRSIGLGAVRCGATLRRLDLAHSGFGCQGAIALATALGTAHTPCALKVLQLGFNSIGADGAAALATALTNGNYKQLEHLDLACNVLGPEGVAALAPLLEPVEEDEVTMEDECDSATSADDGSDESRRSVGLYSLDLAVNNAGGDGERSGIKALMKTLERNTSLRMLNLRGNDLVAEHAGDVAEMLCENTHLTQLNVGYNKIYNEGAWELAEALSENPSLRGLDIQRNEISDDGAEWIRTLLTANAVIEEVDMRSNQLSPEVVDAFGKSFGERVNARWQQEPPKVEKNDENLAANRTMVGEGGGRVAAKKAERAARKAARQAGRGR
jgi:NLR family CARD domain-containing protein 3